MSRFAFCVAGLAVVFSLARVEAASIEAYFPLQVGNSWTYVGDGGSTERFTIIGTQEIGGNTYYQFDDCFTACGFPGWDAQQKVDLLFRYDSALKRILQYCPCNNQDLVRYDFSGQVWGAYGNQMVRSGVDCEVPAGEFTECLEFAYATYVDCGIFRETLAPGIGTAAFFSSWDGEFQLQGYTIIPEPSTLVLFSMGALALLAYAWRRRRSR